MPFEPSAPLPLITADLPGIGGRIKARPDDFDVEEIPAYQPSGAGEFLYLWVEKREMGADYFRRQIARRLDIPPGEVGMAGLKDRHAVTRQMISVPASAEPRLGQLDGDGIRVLQIGRHSNKLKPGHLHGNRFRILVRDVHPDAGHRLGPILERIGAKGLANFYGPQRFGKGGETLHNGLAMLHGKAERGGPRNPFLRKLFLSAAQSALFNHTLARRMGEGLFRVVLPGDVMAKYPFGGMFVAEDVPAEQERLERREIVPAGPLFGKKTFPARDRAAERELSALADAGLTAGSFHGFGKLLQGSRRHNIIYIDDLKAEVEPEGVRVTCTLPAGSYATVLLGELMKSATLAEIEEEGE